MSSGSVGVLLFPASEVTTGKNRDGHRMRRVAQLSEAQDQGRGCSNPCGFKQIRCLSVQICACSCHRSFRLATAEAVHPEAPALLVNINRAPNVACRIVSPSHSRQEEIWYLAAGYPAPGSGVPASKDSNEAGSLQPLPQASDASLFEQPNPEAVDGSGSPHPRELPGRIGDRPSSQFTQLNL